MQKINLIYARKLLGGGSTSFTVHLYRAFEMAGIPVALYRPANLTKPPKEFGSYGIQINPTSSDDLRKLVRDGPSLLVAAEKDKDLPEAGLLEWLLRLGMRTVVHDPNEFTHGGKKGIYDYLNKSLFSPPGPPYFCIRPTMKAFFKDAIFIPHPYVSEFLDLHGRDLPLRKKIACSLARTTFVKRTEIILRANRLLEPQYKIDLLGSENRLYTHHKIKKEFPEFKQGGLGSPFEWGIAPRKAQKYRLAVDLTYFPDDGGGSQYSFMEAWDAGCVNAIHSDWLRYPGEMEKDKNCLCIDGPQSLADLVMEATRKSFVKHLLEISYRGAYDLRRLHDPIKVAKQYYKELTR